MAMRNNLRQTRHVEDLNLGDDDGALIPSTSLQDPTPMTEEEAILQSHIDGSILEEEITNQQNETTPNSTQDDAEFMKPIDIKIGTQVVIKQVRRLPVNPEALKDVYETGGERIKKMDLVTTRLRRNERTKREQYAIHDALFNSLIKRKEGTKTTPADEILTTNSEGQIELFNLGSQHRHKLFQSLITL